MSTHEKRSYFRHPSDVPIVLSPEGKATQGNQQLLDVSHGGIACYSENSIESGSAIKVSIPLTQPEFEAHGTVVWCTPKNGKFELGIQFTGGDEMFKVRMVEQICQIEHYKNEILHEEGRSLSGEEAALEWIKKFASEFPPIDG